MDHHLGSVDQPVEGRAVRETPDDHFGRDRRRNAGPGQDPQAVALVMEGPGDGPAEEAGRAGQGGDAPCHLRP